MNMYKAWPIAKNKVLEVQSMSMPGMVGFGLMFQTRQGDHAGWVVELYLPFFYAHLHYYDTRHELED